MLIGREEEAFDSPEYLYELKLDGDRCLAYLDPQKGTNLINRKGRNMLPYVPELQEMHLRVKERCILDGELIIGSGGKRDFELLRSRLTTTNQYRLKRLAREAPASFVAFDLVYLGRESLIQRPLIERRPLPERNVEEDACLFVAFYIEGRGVEF